MGKPCEWPNCQNLTVFGDKYATTEYGEMCPYHTLMITMYNAKPNKEGKAIQQLQQSDKEEMK